MGPRGFGPFLLLPLFLLFILLAQFCHSVNANGQEDQGEGGGEGEETTADDIRLEPELRGRIYGTIKGDEQTERRKEREFERKKRGEEEANRKFVKELAKVEHGKLEKMGVDRAEMRRIGTFLKDPKNVDQFVKVLLYVTQLPVNSVVCVAQETIESLDKLMRGDQQILLKKMRDAARKSQNMLKKEEKLEEEKQAEKRGGREVNERGRRKRAESGGDAEESASFSAGQVKILLAAKEVAFSLGEKGVEQVLIAEDGLRKCGQNLKEPRTVVVLLKTIIFALDDNKGDDEKDFDLIVEKVVKKLNEKGTAVQLAQKGVAAEKGPAHSWLGELVEKWEAIPRELERKWEDIRWDEMKRELDMDMAETKKKMKRFTIWLFSARHVTDIIQILLFLSGPYGEGVQISLLTLQLFGIDERFTKGLEKIGVKLAAYSHLDPKIVKFVFGANGVVNLVIRQGAEAEEKSDEFENQVNAEELKIAKRKKKMKAELEAEIEFFEKITEEVVQHKGKPMHELMAHFLEKLEKIKAKLEAKWHAKVDKWRGKWAEFDKDKMGYIKERMRRFAAWLVTPDRVINLINLLLTIAGVDGVVYLGLETMKAFGITDLFIDKIVHPAYRHELDHLRGHKHVKATVDFMFCDAKDVEEKLCKEEGVIPRFSQAGKLDENGARQERLEIEADLVDIAADVLLRHKVSSVAQVLPFVGKSLIDLLKDKIVSKDLYLNFVQRWNRAMDRVREKHKNEAAGMGSTTDNSSDELDNPCAMPFHHIGKFITRMCNPRGKKAAAQQATNVGQAKGNHEQKEHPLVLAKSNSKVGSRKENGDPKPKN